MTNLYYSDLLESCESFLNSYAQSTNIASNYLYTSCTVELMNLQKFYKQILGYFATAQLFGFSQEQNQSITEEGYLFVFENKQLIESNIIGNQFDIKQNLTTKLLSENIHYQSIVSEKAKTRTIIVDNRIYILMFYKNAQSQCCYFYVLPFLNIIGEKDFLKEDSNITIKKAQYKALCKNYIKVSKPVTIKEFIVPYRVSYSTFYKNFKTIMGVTFNEYCRCLKVLKLLDYIVFSTNTLSEIAFKMNFRDYSSLYRFVQTNLPLIDVKSIYRYGDI
ncbi:MAG: hypothetical protein LBI72_03140 [Flavobacteriaceae bacterium]|jgi:AraC-like DNA-binding protein|nr:hypothetical protein [Flavobacteriaceae bacterium]